MGLSNSSNKPADDGEQSTKIIRGDTDTKSARTTDYRAANYIEPQTTRTADYMQSRKLQSRKLSADCSDPQDEEDLQARNAAAADLKSGRLKRVGKSKSQRLKNSKEWKSRGVEKSRSREILDSGSAFRDVERFKGGYGRHKTKQVRRLVRPKRETHQI